MACRTSRLVVVLVLSAAAAVLLAVVAVGAAAATATATGTPAVPRAPPIYCAPGQAIPHNPLSGCMWYVASRSCDVAASMLPVFKEICCGQLEHIPAECRCRALRVMMETEPLVVVGAGPSAKQRCRAAQYRFAPAVVAAAECGLRTVHGRPFCHALHAE